jgi:2'-hydroxyisoflavone reductase
MRRVLILGGTAWLGHEIAAQLVARGSAVTCLARGSSGGVPAGAALVTADRTRPGGYDAVRLEQWDEVIELSWAPDLVSGALDALARQAAHWTLISSVSVYAGNVEPGADETASVVEPSDLTDYGQAKVAAERASAAALGDRLLVARPGLIAGPGDRSDRFGYWVARLALADDERVLTPMCDSRAVQVVDVRDLANWVVAAGLERLTGTVNVVGDTHTLRDTLNLAAALANFSGQLSEATDEWLLANGVNYWAGPRSLPLWLPQADAGFAQRSNAAFTAANGTLRSLTETLTDTLGDERARGLDRERRSGLSRAGERELLDRWAEESGLR